MTNPKISQTRLIISGACLFAALTVLSVRITCLQVLNTEEREKMARRTSHYKVEKFPAYRGLIVDRNEEPLVVNVPKTSIFVDKYHLDDENVISWAVAFKELRYTDEWAQADTQKKRNLLANKRFKLINNVVPEKLIEEHIQYAASILAKPLKMDINELITLLSHPKKKYIRIAKDLSESEADFIRRKIREYRIAGISFEKKLTRHYPSPTLATHLIGYTNKEYKGELGIERLYEDKLSGIDGYQKRKRNPNNLSIYSDEEEMVLPQQGLNVQLSIDTSIQSIVEEELEAGLKYAKAQKGCAIVIDPKTGDILAMASRPHYNLNTREGVQYGSSNYIFKTALEPGSTFKVITAAAALNERLVNTKYPSINCEHGYYKDGSVVVKDDHPKGKLTVTKILAQSNNIGSYKLGRQVGKKRFFEYVKDFGFGQPTPLNWKGEVRTKGTVGTSPQEFASATFGYAISATPMHLAIAYSTIANDGVMMRPTLIKGVIENNGAYIEQNPAEELRRVIDSDVARSLRKALVNVTLQGGTGTLAAVPGYQVAGKTGTALKWADGRYLKGRYICSFGGMIPAQDPDFVCYIVVDDPLTNEVKRYGGTLAAPIFAKIAEKTALHRDLSPTEPILTGN